MHALTILFTIINIDILYTKRVRNIPIMVNKLFCYQKQTSEALKRS